MKITRSTFKTNTCVTFSFIFFFNPTNPSVRVTAKLTWVQPQFPGLFSNHPHAHHCFFQWAGRYCRSHPATHDGLVVVHVGWQISFHAGHVGFPLACFSHSRSGFAAALSLCIHKFSYHLPAECEPQLCVCVFGGVLQCRCWMNVSVPRELQTAFPVASLAGILNVSLMSSDS